MSFFAKCFLGGGPSQEDAPLYPPMSIILWCRSAADVSRSDMQRNLFSDYGGSFDAKHLARPTQMNFGHLPTIQGLRRNHGSLLKAGCLARQPVSATCRPSLQRSSPMRRLLLPRVST